jgi:hypothetical protein
VVRRLISAVVALPAALLGVMTAGTLVRAMFDTHPLWHVQPVNLSEAAILRDQATVALMIHRGEDPYLRREVRADLFFNDRTELTPLEAAIATGRADILEIILVSSPPPEPSEWNRVRCLATLEGDGDFGDVLDRFRPESAVLDCNGITKPWK